MMPQFLRTISLLFALDCILKTASILHDGDHGFSSVSQKCPPDFEKIEGIDHKCFHFHTDSERKMIDANFSEAVRTCKGMNSTVVEPASPEEGNTISSMVAKRGNRMMMWINGHDIHMKATLIGTDEEAVLLDSKFMGSLSSLIKIPDELWGSYGPNDPYHLVDNINCVYWTGGAAYKVVCFSKVPVVCELGGPSGLKKYINSFNY